jgi:hypothetical protein
MTSSDASFRRAAQWLQDCVGKHYKCNVIEGRRTWYPTRLLDMANCDKDPSFVKLIHTAEEPPVSPYITLSHRWGGTTPLQLTRQLVSRPQPTFLVADMPTTFQDVLQVSKRLGIRYLWIDSLCIIQDKDNLQDWYREASLMDKVYQHSYCNISAADGEDSMKGLFRDRQPQSLGSQSVGVNLEGFGPDSRLSECIITDAFLWSRNIADSPLNKRGWVFQERLLSPRILHFCRNELFWECREHAACESDPEGLSPVHKLMGFVFVKLWETGSHTTFDLDIEDSDAYWLQFWYRVVVGSYSRMELSVPSDKLIALSGIAKHVMSRMNSTYVAGMWREQLELSLLWYVHRYQTAPRPVSYRAPSWSWASVDGQIAPGHTFENCLIHVEGVVINHVSEDTTGAVTGGWLDLRGILKPMRLRQEDYGQGPEWFISIDNPIVGYGVREDDRKIQTVFLDNRPINGSAFESDSDEERLFFMPAREEATNPRLGASFICLLLRLLEPENATFERIGVATASPDERRKLLLEELDEETKARLPCLRYEKGLHTIRII